VGNHDWPEHAPMAGYIKSEMLLCTPLEERWNGNDDEPSDDVCINRTRPTWYPATERTTENAALGSRTLERGNIEREAKCDDISHRPWILTCVGARALLGSVSFPLRLLLDSTQWFSSSSACHSQISLAMVTFAYHRMSVIVIFAVSHRARRKTRAVVEQCGV